MNRGSKPTFVNYNREEILDVTLATSAISEQIHSWRVTDNETFSDHRLIKFKLKGTFPTRKPFRNPRNTNWDTYRLQPQPPGNALNTIATRRHDLIQKIYNTKVVDEICWYHKTYGNAANPANCPGSKFCKFKQIIVPDSLKPKILPKIGRKLLPAHNQPNPPKIAPTGTVLSANHQAALPTITPVETVTSQAQNPQNKKLIGRWIGRS